MDIKEIQKQVKAHKIVQRPVADLMPYARNSRKHEDWQIAKIANSIKEFGFTNPVMVGADGTIIAGHARVMAALRLDLLEVPCVILDHLTDAQKRAYVIADNRLSELSAWDNEMLKVEIEELKIEEFNSDLTGFSEFDIARLFDTQSIGSNPEDEWKGMPEFDQEDKTAFRQVIVNFKNQEAVDDFSQTIGQQITNKTRYIWHPMIEDEKLIDKVYLSES